MKALPSLAACALLLSLAACARSPRAAAGPVLAPALAAPAGGGVFQTGVASWYGDDFQGRATANGEIYDMRKLTAAHPELPFHTLVEVENLENGRRVLVRINDRGPFLKGRIIDLSLKAAQRLEMAEKGTAAVNLRVLRRGGQPQQAQGVGAAAWEAEGVRGGFVQAGAFAVRENAEELLLTLEEIFPGLGFRVASEDGLFKLISPPLDPAACGQVLKKLSAHGLQGFIRESGTGPGE
jgi:hypothetical protein